MNESTPDVLIVGGGLSGSRVVVGLLERLEQAGRPPLRRPLEVVVLDRLGAFGGGIPYGETAHPGFLLIEPVALSTPPEFHRWLHRHRVALAERCRRAPPESGLPAWIATNESRLLDGRYEDLFVPRRFFGEFARETLRDAIRAAQRSHRAQVRLLTGEVADIEAADPGHRVTLADGRSWRGVHLVLAVGTIPRAHPPGLTAADGYFHDLYRERNAFDAVADTVRAQSARLGRGVDVAVLGANAAGIEAIYYLKQDPQLYEQTRAIHVLSRSGALPEALQRPSAREYAQAAAAAGRDGRLRVAKAVVRGVSKYESRLRVETDDGGVAADIVINCLGASPLAETGSPLLRRITGRGPFTPNGLGRGFELAPGAKRLHGRHDAFVIGPLLNGESSDTHVESIRAVWRVAEEVADGLYASIRAWHARTSDDETLPAAAAGLRSA